MLSVVQNVGFKINSIFEQYQLYENHLLDRIFVALYLQYKMVFERPLVKFLRENQEKLEVVFDVGGGFGFYSYIIAKSDSCKKVFCFEPDEINFKRVTRVAMKGSLKGKIECVKAAVTSSPKEMFLIRDSLNPANHRSTDERELGVPVEGVSIDIFCFSQDTFPTLIKVDVQGHEIQVLKGAVQTIQSFKPLVILEFDPQNEIESQLDCWQFMKSWGYLAFEIRKKGRLHRLVELPKKSNYFDLVFIHKEFPFAREQ